MKKTRQRLFYETLILFSKIDANQWWNKRKIANNVNGTHNANVGYFTEPLYVINNDPLAHDICSQMNTDRIKINESLEFEKIILVKDNKFKIATLEETIAEEEKIRADALRMLWRGSLIKAKRLQNGQIIVDFENEIERVIETFGGKYE